MLILKNLQDISETRGFHKLLYFVLFLILILRRPDALLNPQPWAEDAVIFISGGMYYSYNSLFIPFAGYFHTIPRIVTLFALHFGPGNAPLIMNLSAIVLSVYCVGIIFDEKFRFLIRNDGLRFLLPIIIIALPIKEIYLNITHIQFFLTFYLTLWTMEKMNISEKISTFDVILPYLALLTCPMSFVLLPAFVFILFRKYRDGSIFRLDTALYSAVPSIILTTLIVLTRTMSSHPINLPPALYFIRFVSIKLITTLFFADTNYLLVKYGFFIAYIVFVIVIILLISGIRKEIDGWLWLFLILYILILVAARPEIFPFFAHSPIIDFPHDRFLFYPMALILILFMRNLETSKLKGLYALALIIVMVNITFHYELPAYYDFKWKSQVNNINLSGKETYYIPINPSNWYFAVPSDKYQDPLVYEFWSGGNVSYDPKWTTWSVETINGETKHIIMNHPQEFNITKVEFKNINIPENASMKFNIAINPQSWTEDGDGVEFDIYIKVNNSTLQSFKKYINPKRNVEERKWNEFELNLSKFSGKKVDLLFTTSSEHDNWAWWGDPIILSNKSP